MLQFEVKRNVAVLKSPIHINHSQMAYELVQGVRHQTGCQAVVTRREHFDQKLFDLSSNMAVDLLRVFTLEQMTLVIVGDFYDCYQTPMRELIFRCNRGHQVGFWETEEEGIAWINRKK